MAEHADQIQFAGHTTNAGAESPFAPEKPHVSVALVLTGTFLQLADPLDWMAQRLGLEVKVERTELAESLAYGKRGPLGAAAPVAEARGTDKRTRFRLEVVGRCEGKMVALCRMTFNPLRHALKDFEDPAIALTVLNPRVVLGVQGTAGAQYHTLKAQALTRAKTFMRLLPLSVLNRAFFRAQIEAVQQDKNVHCIDMGEASLLTLTKPWLFYDMPVPRHTARGKFLLPFPQG